ncbi:hypothetical protein B0H14DRAFT_3448851 [Mycena olivaceomarginata]|nr:hypothetical protein B0H14DRAFT_3448851 [Mycena olivaceomarginata]
MDSIRLASSTASARAPPRRLRHDFRRLSTPCPPMALEQLGIMNGLLRFAPSPRRLRGNNRRRTPSVLWTPTRPASFRASTLFTCAMPSTRSSPPPSSHSESSRSSSCLPLMVPAIRKRELALILDSSMVGAIEHTHTVSFPTAAHIRDGYDATIGASLPPASHVPTVLYLHPALLA